MPVFYHSTGMAGLNEPAINSSGRSSNIFLSWSAKWHYLQGNKTYLKWNSTALLLQIGQFVTLRPGAAHSYSVSIHVIFSIVFCYTVIKWPLCFWHYSSPRWQMRHHDLMLAYIFDLFPKMGYRWEISEIAKCCKKTCNNIQSNKNILALEIK